MAPPDNCKQLTAARIERAKEGDIPTILSMVNALAAFVGRSHDVKATEEDFRRTLFGKQPSAEVALAFVGTEPIGIAVYFLTYSTFLGRAGMYLEDLFVLPQWRKQGYGSQLLAFVASTAVRPNAALQRTVESVTSFAFAKAAPLFPAAHVRC
jgi:GNAT superfamily N-acetyltransferase